MTNELTCVEQEKMSLRAKFLFLALLFSWTIADARSFVTADIISTSRYVSVSFLIVLCKFPLFCLTEKNNCLYSNLVTSTNC